MMPIRRFSDQSWFPDLFNDFFDNDRMIKACTTAPSVNIVEEEKDYKIEVAAPGMTKNDFDVHLDDDNELIVGMEKKTEKNESDSKNRKYLHREFSYSQFKQSFTLPDNVDREHITANVSDGVLTVCLPKKEECDKKELGHKIEIQ